MSELAQSFGDSTLPMVVLDGVSKVFGNGPKAVVAVDNVSLTINRGEIFAIIGYSGAGKSTLVRLINGLETTTSGTLTVGGFEISGKRDSELREARTNIGMIFQQFNLMNSRTVLGNVEFPLKIAGWSKKDRRERALEMLEFVGLADRAGHYPNQLSGGQKQRVSLAAALIGRPDVLFLDEPSAGLDPQSRNVVFDIIREQRELGTAIVLTTHLIDDAQKLADYVYIIENGATVQEGTVSELIASDGTNRLQYTLDAPTPTREQLLPAHLRAGVELIEKAPYTPARDGAPSVPGAYELVGALRPEHLAAFTSALAERYLMPISLTMEPKTLEDVFLDISGRDIR